MTSDFILEIDDLKANINDIEILKGINLKIKRGIEESACLIMGPNGSGKSLKLEVMLSSESFNRTSVRMK